MSLIVNAKPLIAALERSAGRADIATAAAATAGAAVFVSAIKQELGRGSHPAGTPTGAVPGGPPQRITGTLQNSVRVFPPKRIGPGRYEGSAGPGEFYGRFQQSGTHHQRTFPFIEQATHGAELAVHAAVEKAWSAALGL